MSDTIGTAADSGNHHHVERETNARIALALSILQHRSFCPDCRTHAGHAQFALLGASIDELNAGVADA